MTTTTAAPRIILCICCSFAHAIAFRARRGAGSLARGLALFKSIRRRLGRSLALPLLLLAAGCQSVSYTHTYPTGERIDARGASLLKNVALAELDVPGKVKLRGYQQTGDAATVKAAMEGAGTIAGEAVRAAVGGGR